MQHRVLQGPKPFVRVNIVSPEKTAALTSICCGHASPKFNELCNKAPCTLNRWNVKKAALFLRLGLPSTRIRHENGAFRKRSSNRPEEFVNVGFSFSCGRKTF